LLKKSHLILLILVFLGGAVSAQQGMYIPAGDTVWVPGNATVGLFSDMINHGTLGSGSNSLFYFFSQRWTNGNGSTLPDESADGVSGAGGTFVFNGTSQQKVFGGYSFITRTGPGFPNLEINNPSGLLLDDLSDLKIRNNLHFGNGHIYLNGWNLQVGEKSPGTITGYSDRRFVVTGNSIAGGSLYRAAISNAAGKVVFPVGTDDNGYEPAAVLLTGAPDMIGARVYDSVYTVAAGGVPYPDYYVNKTWNIRRVNNTGGETDVILQHMDADELPVYAASRDSSFITRFVSGVWDNVTTLPAKPLAGTLTTSPMTAPATMHLRHFSVLGNNEFFTKTSWRRSSKPAMFLDFEAYRVAPLPVQLNWITSKEIYNALFEVERRYENEAAFSKVAVVFTKAVNGNSSVPLSYSTQDLNGYDDWTYYRIKAVGKNGKAAYSEVRAVPPFVQINIYPNPNNGKFSISLRGIRREMQVDLRDIWGQSTHRYSVKTDTDINVSGVPSGTYFLVIYYKDTMTVAYTCKVVVLQ
jgi:hypothetical protein